jgi:hypothetical protein
MLKTHFNYNDKVKNQRTNKKIYHAANNYKENKMSSISTKKTYQVKKRHFVMTKTQLAKVS